MAFTSVFAGFNKFTALVIAVCVVDSITIAFDGSLMGSLNVMPSYTSYFHLNTALTAVNTCATFIGAILIGPWSGMLIDKKGRKVGIYTASVINILGAVISGSAQNTAMFIAGRIIIGIGCGFAQTSAATYVSETTAPSVRSLALGLYYSCWAVGALLASGVSYGTSSMEPRNWAWRIPSFLQGAPALLAIALLFFAPESPRWLIHSDRHQEGLGILAKINGADPESPLVQLQYHEVVDTMKYEKEMGKHIGFREVVRTSPNRRRLALALSVAPLAMLTGSNIVTYYFGSMLTQAGISDSKVQLEINVILSVWQLVCAVTGSCLAEKLGRRVLALASLGSCSMFFFLFSGLSSKFGKSTDTSGVYGTISCIFLFLGSYSFGITPLTAMYAPEVLAYNMRATGIALQLILVKSCGLLVTLAFPFMIEALAWKTYIVNGSWNILIWLYIYFQWVETKGKTLEEIDELFDGEKHLSAPNLEDLKYGEEAAVKIREVRSGSGDVRVETARWSEKST